MFPKTPERDSFLFQRRCWHLKEGHQMMFLAQNFRSIFEHNAKARAQFRA